MKTKTFNPFNGASHDEINAILATAYVDEDPKVFTAALGMLVKHYGVSEVAEHAKLNRQNLYKTIEGKTSPQWDTVHKLMHVLGIKLTVAI